MSLELGDRLAEVGLLTRAQLGRHGTQPHGAALARLLVDAGLLPHALAGFFVSEGFGPLQGAPELAAAEPTLLGKVPAEMAVDFLVLPLRDTPSGVLVAMAVPSDRHLVREVGRALGRPVLPTVALLSDLRRELGARLPGVAPPVDEREPEPIVLELVRRRGGAEEQPPRSQRITADIRPPVAPPVLPAEEGEPIALVRHKPIASKPRIDPAAIRAEGPSGGAEQPKAAPAAPADRPSKVTFKGVIPSKRFVAPTSARPKTSTSEYGQPPRESGPPVPVGTPPASASAAPPAAAAPAAAPPAGEAKDGAAPASEASPAQASSPPADGDTTASKKAAAGDSWDLPPPVEKERPSGKLGASKGALPGNKGSVPDVAPLLASMKSARDRDAIVRIACEGAVTVGRCSIFLALRKGVLKGWDGAGQGVSRDSVRNLWIPSSSDSMFKKVLDSGAPFVGAYGSGIADGLFRAAVGSRGGDVAVWPVLIEGKVVGLLCVDDLRPGSVSRHRIETLTVAVAEGFRRLIHGGKGE